MADERVIVAVPSRAAGTPYHIYTLQADQLSEDASDVLHEPCLAIDAMPLALAAYQYQVGSVLECGVAESWPTTAEPWRDLGLGERTTDKGAEMLGRFLECVMH